MRITLKFRRARVRKAQSCPGSWHAPCTVRAASNSCKSSGHSGHGGASTSGKERRLPAGGSNCAAACWIASA